MAKQIRNDGRAEGVIEYHVEEIDVLIAARTAWEMLRDEFRGHENERDVFLCLVCHRKAKAFVDAVQALSDRLSSVK